MRDESHIDIKGGKMKTTYDYVERWPNVSQQSPDQVMMVVVVLAFSSLARILGECSTIQSPPAFFKFFFKVEISSHTLSPLFRPESVHSGSASWEDCGKVFPDELRVNLFPDRFHTTPGQRYSQPTPTSLGQGCMRVYVQPATCIFGRMTEVFYVTLR